MERHPITKEAFREIVNIANLYYGLRTGFYKRYFHTPLLKNSKFIKQFVLLRIITKNIDADPEDYIWGNFSMYAMFTRRPLYPTALVTEAAVKRYSDYMKTKHVKRHKKSQDETYYLDKIKKGLGVSLSSISDLNI